MDAMNSMFSVEFRDCNAYFDAINHLNVRFTVQEVESCIWRISSLALPGGVEIQHCRSGSGSIAQGASRTGGFELAVAERGHFSAYGATVPPESAMFMVPGSEFLVSIPRAHSWFGVFIPESVAISIGLLEAQIVAHARDTTRVLRNANPAAYSVPSLLARFFANALATPEIVRSEQALMGFEVELHSVLGKAYGYAPESARKHPGRTPIVDHAVINRALDAIEAAPEPTVAMAELEQITNVSERSLRAGFRRYLGLSPTRYMQLRTLSRARRRLAAGRPDELSVAQVGTDLGVWDLGRFAARYRQLFGELPSRTLRRPG